MKAKGIWDFTNGRITNLPIPTNDNEAAPKKWTEDLVSGGFPIPGNTIKGNPLTISELPTNISIAQNSILGRLVGNIENIPLVDAYINPIDAGNFETVANWDISNTYQISIDSALQGQKFNGNNYWYLMYSNTIPLRIQKYLDNLCVLRNTFTISTNTETNIGGTYLGSKTIPNNYLAQGQSYNFFVRGLVTSSEYNNMTVRIKNGSTVLATIVVPSEGTNQYFDMEFTGTFNSVGETGTFRGQGKVQMESGSYPIKMTSNVTVDTELPVDFEVSTQFASGTNSVNITNFIITQHLV
jgi:hypothetical protein